MQAGVVAVIPNGTIVIIKDAVPDDSQDFSFNLNNASTINQGFLLDDDSQNGLSDLLNSQTFSVPPGAWTATELSIPTGWTLTNLVCSDPSGNTSKNVLTGIASIDLYRRRISRWRWARDFLRPACVRDESAHAAPLLARA